MRKILLYLSLVAGIAALAQGYASQNHLRFAKALLVLGGLWFVALRMRYLWASSIGFGVSTLAAAWGLWNGLSLAWILAGVVGVFIAWDLTYYAPALPFHSPNEEIDVLELRHFVKLAILSAFVLGFGSLTFLAKGIFPLMWGALLALFGVWILALFWKWNALRKKKTARRL